MIGIPFMVDLPSDFVEFSGLDFADPQELVRQNAMGKAKTVALRHPDALVLGVDTVVSCEGQIFEKPKDAEDAFQMLQLLQGKTHTVYTGIHLVDSASGAVQSVVDATEVDFLPMSEATIRAYISTGEPMDKAGAYAIQGLGAVHIRGIRGDFFNVVGLPVSHLKQMLSE